MPAMTASTRYSTPLTHENKLWPGLALAALGAICFSGKAIIVKLAYRHGVDAVTLLMLRMLFALPMLFFWPGSLGAARPR